MKRLIILSLTALLAACGGIKLANSQYQTISGDKANADRDRYTFLFSKKAGNYVEIVEVKLLNTEKGMDASAPFKVMDKNADQVILDVKGRSEFAVVAIKPQTNNSTLASSALIVYRTEQDGEKKYYTVKKIGQ